MDHRVKDISLAKLGKKDRLGRGPYACSYFIKKKYEDSQPLKGQRVAGCLHVTKETGVLVRTLRRWEQNYRGAHVIH